MSDQKSAKLKALQITLDKLDKTYGKGSVMKLGDEAVEEKEWQERFRKEQRIEEIGRASCRERV